MVGADELRGQQTRWAVARFLAELQVITQSPEGGMVADENLVLLGLLSLCGYSAGEGHDMPMTVKRMLEVLSEERRAMANNATSNSDQQVG